MNKEPLSNEDWNEWFRMEQTKELIKVLVAERDKCLDATMSAEVDRIPRLVDQAIGIDNALGVIKDVAEGGSDE